MRTSPNLRLVLALAGLSVMSALSAAERPIPSEAMWHCHGAGVAMRMQWREVSAAEGCDGEACRMTAANLTEGVLFTEQGRRVGVLGLQGNAGTGWAFRDVDGRAWQLHVTGHGLAGVVALQSKRTAISCAPLGSS